MKKLIALFAGLFLMTIAAQNVIAQNPIASATANSSATIIQPISIVKVEGKDLLFGNIIASAAGGSVVIATTGTPTLTGVAAPSVPGTRQAATFTVTGMAGVTYAITLPASTNLTSGGNTMTVDNFLSDPNGTGLLTGGTQTLNVGAKLNVGPAQPAGTYTGSFAVTVGYN